MSKLTKNQKIAYAKVEPEKAYGGRSSSEGDYFYEI